MIAGGVFFVIMSVAPTGNFFDPGFATHLLGILERVGAAALGIFMVISGGLCMYKLLLDRRRGIKY
jgi:hypothetical protein